MKKTALRSCTLAFGLALLGSSTPQIEALDVFTDPVGYYTLNIQGASDNVMSLPMVRDAVFSGTVGSGVTATGFNALAGTASPGWTASQFKYVAPGQPQTFYVEFTSGQLKGLYYKVNDNGANSLALDTEGDTLLDHDFPGTADQALAVGDSFKIRPYWRLKDVFEVNGAPIIDPYPALGQIRDSILIPNYTSVGINKAANVILYYLQGVGWQKSGDEGEDYGNFILRPNEAFVVRRLNAAPVSLTNLGGVLMNKVVSFIPGGGATTANDTFFSLNRPAPVKLDDSGLSTVVEQAAFIGGPADFLLAFAPGTGVNRAPSKIYYYLSGQGWRESGDDDVTTIGQTVFIEPGKVYVLRKKSNAPGKDWVNTANY